MSAWWYHLWNDPMRDNPWSIGVFIVAVAAVFAVTYGVASWQIRRRRRQETTMEAANPEPISPAAMRDPDPDDKQLAEEAIADAREVREGVREVREKLEDLTGQDDGEPVIGLVKGSSEESDQLALLMNTDPRLIADPLGAPLRQEGAADKDALAAAEQRFGTREMNARIRELSPRRLTDNEGRALRDIGAGEYGEFVMASPPQPGRNILAKAPVSAAPTVSPVREPCKHCEGTGYMPSVSDHLRESIALVGDSGDQIVKAFYAELLSVAPDLAGLFPPDLLTVDEIKGQRDKLLKALVALSEMYDPADADKMARLDVALGAFGRSHAAFSRPDGTVQGATWEEYAAVKTVLFRTLAAAAGAAWKPEYTLSWSQAYDYAAAVMTLEQIRSGFTAPRFPRS